MAGDIAEKLKQICSLIDSIIEDHSVPRNIRVSLENCKNRMLKETTTDPRVAMASAIYALDEAANDINMPAHMRTSVWNVISELERLKEEIK
ncbi:UPF0147 family protein [Candidatus Micrarchaeota archaeon]|nr:UPF0147 family protein [Candidatus Micrarchaeota archaeon]